MSDYFKKAMKKLYPQAPHSGTLPEDGFGRTEFTHAILHHQTQEALSLLKHYDNVNHKDNGGYSDLYFAAQSCELEVLRELLRRGADPNIETYAGGTPLTAALDSVQRHSHRKDFNSYECAFEIIKLLLEAGADPDKKSKSGSTPRQLAKYMAPGEIAEYLKNYPPLDE